MNELRTSTLFSSEQIQTRVQEMADQITSQLKGKRVVAIGMLKGSIRFYCDLVSALKIDVICDFYSASSYGLRNKPSKEVRIDLDITVDLEDKHVILIDDVVDRGITLTSVLDHLKARSPRSITTAVLLHKPDQTQKKVKLDYIGFEIKGDPFIVGYGMDYHEKMRNLPCIAKIN